MSADSADSLVTAENVDLPLIVFSLPSSININVILHGA